MSRLVDALTTLSTYHHCIPGVLHPEVFVWFGETPPLRHSFVCVFQAQYKGHKAGVISMAIAGIGRIG